MQKHVIQMQKDRASSPVFGKQIGRVVLYNWICDSLLDINDFSHYSNRCLRYSFKDIPKGFFIFFQNRSQGVVIGTAIASFTGTLTSIPVLMP